MSVTHPNAALIDHFAAARDEAASEGNKGHIIHNSRMVKLLQNLTKICCAQDLAGIKGVGPKSRAAIESVLESLPTPEGKNKRKRSEQSSSSSAKKSKNDDEKESDDDDGGETTDETKLPSLLLAHTFDFDKHDATDWLLSEKLDGVRAYWCGRTFWSRQGNRFNAPEWFTKHLPTTLPLDGELFCGRGRFQETVSVVRKHVPVDEEWREIHYCVFDSPDDGVLEFEERLTLIDKHIGDRNQVASVVEHRVCESNAHLRAELDKMVAEKGEGLMLREPKSKYQGKRSRTLLKVKKTYDAEARVLEHVEGKGRNTGRCGALRCEMACGKRFKIGSGLNDADRECPPLIGSIVTYHFNDLTKAGLPRFPTFARVRHDVSEPRDLLNLT